MNIDATKILSSVEILTALEDLHRLSRRSLNTRQNLTVFRLSTCCGLRASEICGLVLRDVHAFSTKPWIDIRKTVGKGSKARRVPLWWDMGTLTDIQAWWRHRSEMQLAGGGDPFVCTLQRGGGRRLDRFNVRKRFLAACASLGVQRRETLTIHHGRHSFCSHALAAGRTLVEVQRAAGHANIAVTNTYLHLTGDDGKIGNAFAFAGNKP